MKETLMNDERNCFGLNLLHAEELEDAVVGAAMLETNSLNEIIGFVRPEMFYKKDNRYIWEAIEALVKAGLQPDLLMVAHKLAEMGRLEEAGIPTGIPELDRMTGGWQPGNLIFTAGRPGLGKTQLGLKFAMHAAEKGYRVLLYTLEMMTEEVGERVLMMRVPDLYKKVKSGYVTSQEVENLVDVAKGMEDCRLMVDDTPYVSIDQLCAGARTVKSRWGLDMVIVDYLQLVGTNVRAGRNREQEVAECSRRLKALARALECPVIVACQLNRQVEQTFDHRPELKHLRESGSIEQDADLVLMLHRTDRNGDAKRCGLIVAKNRHGEVSKPNSCMEVELF